ncbi:MAG: hypothetical protein KC423_16745, partial [Anaerolineales bacterium]|nr:hypothetical protein [Anaerolineales bacterium]
AILDATVRFEIETWVSCGGGCKIKHNANGHGTIMNGRYLLTHNHLDETIIARLLTGNNLPTLTITLYDSNGQLIAKLSAEHVAIAAVDSEAIVLDFGYQNGTGFFQALGLPSAQFIAATQLTLEVGAVVAQIDWDGTTTCVEWATIDAIETISGTPVAQLSNGLEHGASGGGVYWNGIHIGNNWKTSTCMTTPSKTIENHSYAALNTSHVLNPGQLKPK